ncbi:major capsid protein [Aurantimonas sp. C2-6-R+9]|uniref:major capsid protein n=1 Tax=unclassified Aurantimonas TaxID=2638230 RepID=UPI002E16C128|nr:MULTISPECIES: major capsid protein [unclassified Aurantimonas]MEC5291979.1 major capsid protein [Aurantimonas sp. C2-3-R2]MEC5382091.1 major capsid protein [Aurantimonas sp. C2-6-R+9]MEC5413064.1 major capsid protein [Aurantimonas sp. C2-4-R8]
MNTRQAAVVEPILTTQARGYQNAEMIGHLLLPVVDVPNRNMRVIKFGKESFRKRNTRRAPGAETMRVEYGYASDPISLFQEALEGLVPTEQAEEADKVPHIDLGAEATREVQDIIHLGRETQTADLVRDPATYAADHVEVLVGADKWSDPASDPMVVIDDGRETVRKKIGRDPNCLTLGPGAFRALRRHPKIKEQFKYVSAESITTEMLAQYFDVEEVLVGRAVYLPENADDAAPALDVWGDDAILSYKPKATSFRVPAFGYTYRLKGYPLVEAPYYERNRKSWVYPVTEEYRSYVTGADGGFLIRSVV